MSEKVTKGGFCDSTKGEKTKDPGSDRKEALPKKGT